MADTSNSESTAVVVAVRCRPFNERERKKGSPCCVEMNGNQTKITDPKTKKFRSFAFDNSFWSHDPSQEANHATQAHVYATLGEHVLRNAISGFNACIFAYGQTGAGKTYSMMGGENDRGIIPRLCGALFDEVKQRSTNLHKWSIEISYMEIYNEQVFDLLSPSSSKTKGMRIRNHKTIGPYVEGLSRFAVGDYDTLETFMKKGNEVRSTAATKMNDTSSRSHALFTINLQQIMMDDSGEHSIGEKTSKISLVDLAGSERQTKTNATGERLKEGSTINKSLTTLGMVIAALAERSKNGKDDTHIPFRASTLTFLLKENLGGNSKTVMLAAISPAAENYQESISTLRYADRAKSIVNKAFVNEDATAVIIQNLRAELESLRVQASTNAASLSLEEAERLKAEMVESQRLLADANLSWEDKLQRTETELRARAEKAEIEAEQKEFENEELRLRMAELEAEKERLEREREELASSAIKPQEVAARAEEALVQSENVIYEERRRREQLEAMLVALEAKGAKEKEELQREQQKLTEQLVAKQALVDAEQDARHRKEKELESERESRRRSQIVNQKQQEEVLGMLAKQQKELTSKVAETEATAAQEAIRRHDLERRLVRQHARKEDLNSAIALVREITALETQLSTSSCINKKLQSMVTAAEQTVLTHISSLVSSKQAMSKLVEFDKAEITSMATVLSIEQQSEHTLRAEEAAQQERIESEAAYNELVDMLNDRIQCLISVRDQNIQAAKLEEFEKERARMIEELDKLKGDAKAQEDLLLKVTERERLEKEAIAMELEQLRCQSDQQQAVLMKSSEAQRLEKERMTVELDRLKQATEEQQNALKRAGEGDRLEKEKAIEELEQLRKATEYQKQLIHEATSKEQEARERAEKELNRLKAVSEEQTKALQNANEKERIEREIIAHELNQLHESSAEQRRALQAAAEAERIEKLRMEKQLAKVLADTKEQQESFTRAAEKERQEKEREIENLRIETARQQETLNAIHLADVAEKEKMQAELERLNAETEQIQLAIAQVSNNDRKEKEALLQELEQLQSATTEQHNMIASVADKERKDKENLAAELSRLKEETTRREAELQKANKHNEQEKEKLAAEIAELKQADKTSTDTNDVTPDSNESVPMIRKNIVGPQRRNTRIGKAMAAFEKLAVEEEDAKVLVVEDAKWQRWKEIRASFEVSKSLDIDEMEQKFTTAEIHERELATRRLEVDRLKALQLEAEHAIETERRSSLKKRREFDAEKSKLKRIAEEEAKEKKLLEVQLKRQQEEEQAAALAIKAELDVKVAESKRTAEEEAVKLETLRNELAAAKEAQYKAAAELKSTKKASEEHLTRERDAANKEFQRVKEELELAKTEAERRRVEELCAEPPTHEAIHAFEAVETDDLDLEEGDMITLKLDNNDGWYSGFNHRTKILGIFPKNYVEELPPPSETPKSDTLLRRAKSFKKPSSISIPMLNTDPSELLAFFLESHSRNVVASDARRNAALLETKKLQLDDKADLTESSLVEDQISAIAQRVETQEKPTSDGEHGDIDATITSKSLKLSVDLRALEARAQEQLKYYKDTAELLLKISGETATANADSESFATEQLAKACSEGVSGVELEYLKAKYSQEKIKNDGVYRICLESAAGAVKIKEAYFRALERIRPLFVALLGVSDEAARNKRIEEAQAAKMIKRRRAISSMAQASFGDSKFDSKAHLEKYLIETTGLSKFALRGHVDVGKHVIQGWLLKPRKEALERWYKRYFMLDLRDRVVTYKQMVDPSDRMAARNKKKGEIYCREILSCTTTNPRMLPKHGKTEEGEDVTNTFVVVTSARTWYFAADTQVQRDIWVTVFQAMCQE